MPDPTKTVTNQRIAKLIQYEPQLDAADRQELETYRALGQAPKKPGASLTEAQGKATGFYGRALEADQNFNATLSSVQPRPYIAYKGAEAAPDYANTQASPDRQLSEQAKRNFILASLRYESGASINADEFAKQERAFFPMPGDAPATIAQKAHDRKVVIQGLSEGSGPGADGMNKAESPTATDYSKELSGKFEPYQAQLYSNFREANPKATPAQLKEFTDAIGTTLADPNAPSPGAKVEVPLVAAGSANIIGPSTGPRMTVDVHDETAAQTPEFRAGLAKLLSDPKVGADEIRQYWAQNAKGAPAPATPAEAEKIAPLAVERGKNGVTDRIDSAIRGAADTASLGFADEIAAGADTIFGNKTMAENLAAERGVDAYDQQNHGVMRFLGQLGGGAFLPMGEAPTAGSLAVRGGAYGAGYGFGSTNGSLKDRFVGAGIGGATGAAGGYGLGKLSELFRGRGPMPPNPGTGNEVADAAGRQNIPIIAADANPGARGATSFLETVPGSTGLIRNRMQNTVDAIENRVGSLTPGHIAPAERDAVGDLVQRGAQNWIQKSGDIGNKLYTRAQELSGGVKIQPKGALESLDEQIADLSRTPATNKAKIDILNSVRSDMVDAAGNPKPLDIDSIRAIRTNVREQMNTANVRSSDLDRRLGMVMDAANEDIAGGLASNPRALGAYNRADTFWRDRAERVDNVLNKVIGKADDTLSGEQVMAKIEGMAAPRTGNADNLRTLLSSLRPDEREQVAANVAHALGRATPEAEFSAQRFFTQVNKLSPKARVAIFGKNGSDALADLATVAEGRADTMARMNNSGSGRVSNWWRALRGTMGIGVGYGAATSPEITAATTGLALGGANISARVLTNPAMARWFAQGLRATSAGAIRNSMDRLGQIATSNPAIRTEVLSIQKALAQAVNDNAPQLTRAAASNGKGPDDEQ